MQANGEGGGHSLEFLVKVLAFDKKKLDPMVSPIEKGSQKYLQIMKKESFAITCHQKSCQILHFWLIFMQTFVNCNSNYPRN